MKVRLKRNFGRLEYGSVFNLYKTGRTSIAGQFDHEIREFWFVCLNPKLRNLWIEPIGDVEEYRELEEALDKIYKKEGNVLDIEKIIRDKRLEKKRVQFNLSEELLLAAIRGKRLIFETDDTMIILEPPTTPAE